MMDELKDAPRIDFNMTLKSKGLNKLIKDLFDQMPGKPPQSTYKGRLRNCMRIILINLNNTDEYISYSRNDHSKEYRRKNYSAKNIRKVVDFLIYNGWVENERGYFNDDPDNRRMSRMRCRKKLRELFVAYDVNQNNIRIGGTYHQGRISNHRSGILLLSKECARMRPQGRCRCATGVSFNS